MRFSAKIDSQLQKLRLEEYVGVSMKHTKIRAMLHGALAPLGVSVRIKRDDSVLASSGVYYPTEERPIVYVHFRAGTEEIRLTEKRINKLLLRVSQNAQHELLHQEQDSYTAKPFPISYSSRVSTRRADMIAYLNDWYEIECYAHDIAIEAAYFYPTISPQRILQQPDLYKKLTSYRIYLRTFAGMDWTPIRKELLKTAWKWSKSLSSIPPTPFP
jgi:hypothetical protein